MIQYVINAMDVVQNLDYISHLHRLEGLSDLALSEDGFHLLTGQSAARHPGRGVCKINYRKIVQSMKIPLFLLILQFFGQFWQLGLRCILQNCPRGTDCVLWNAPNAIPVYRAGDSALCAVSSD